MPLQSSAWEVSEPSADTAAQQAAALNTLLVGGAVDIPSDVASKAIDFIGSLAGSISADDSTSALKVLDLLGGMSKRLLVTAAIANSGSSRRRRRLQSAEEDQASVEAARAVSEGALAAIGQLSASMLRDSAADIAPTVVSVCCVRRAAPSPSRFAPAERCAAACMGAPETAFFLFRA